MIIGVHFLRVRERAWRASRQGLSFPNDWWQSRGRTVRFRACAILCLCFGACTATSGGSSKLGLEASPSDADGGDPSADGADAFAEFDTVILDFLDEYALEGASAVVVDQDRGVLYAQGYGAFAADRVYLIASTGKILSVGVLMRLADQGLVDLDLPISTYVGQAWGSSAKADITVAQLLSNSSGMVGLLDRPLYVPYLCQYQAATTLAACAQQLYVARDGLTRVDPDTTFRYGGAQWQVAGGIAEAAGGKAWAQLVEETYVVPCDVSSLGYTNQYGEYGTDYPADFDGDITNLPDTENPSIEGGVHINVEDYGKLLTMHLRGGVCEGTRVLSAAAVARMQDDRILEAYNGSTGVDGLAGYGLGWWIDRDSDRVFLDPGAYGAVSWLDLARDYGAFIALEASSAGNGLGVELATRAKPVLDALFDAGEVPDVD